MKFEEFKRELDKLAQRFDKKYYPEEAYQVLYNEVKNLDVHWLKKHINIFLVHHKPSLLFEFREVARIEKDRIRMERPFDQYARTEESMFDEEDVKFLFALTKRIAKNEIKDREIFVTHFNPVLEKVIATKDKKTAKALFKEVGELYKIPFEQNI